MKVSLRLLALPAILAMAVGPSFAATNAAMVVQAVSTDDPEAYNAVITKINAVMKEKTGLDRVRRVWVGDFAGDNSHMVFVTSTFPSAAAQAEFAAKLKDDPAFVPLMAELKPMRHLGPSWLFKAVRDEGFYDGGAVFNTNIVVTDEGAYLKALDDLKAIFDANGFKDAKVNLWRVVSGRKESSHLVVISLPSAVRVAELLDKLSDDGLLKDWYGSAAKVRTSLSNGSYHEITK